MMPRYSRSALHELRRLPQLDLKDDRQIAIAAHPIEMHARDRPKPRRRVGERRHAGAPCVDRLAHGAIEDRDEQVVLAAEIQVDGAGGDPCGPRDVGHLRVEEAARGKDVDGGAEDRLALVPALRHGSNGCGGH